LYYHNTEDGDKNKNNNSRVNSVCDESIGRYVKSRYLSRFFDCLAHPNLSEFLATDKKLPLRAWIIRGVETG
jgi:hypothetical protein